MAMKLIALILAIVVVVWWFSRATDGYDGHKDEAGQKDDSWKKK